MNDTRRRRLARLGMILGGLVAIGSLGLLYPQVRASLAPVEPPPMRPPAEQADRVRVFKAARRLELWQGDTQLAAYRISLGGAPAAGHKQREGDQRTPEGHYVLNWRNPRSIAHLSLHVSYPNATDRAAAAQAGHDPGGAIMIHGLPNGWGWLGRLHRLHDWTDGCIAVTNDEMREIWARVPDGTAIEIRA